MSKKIIFQDSFLVSGIMCFTGCGATIQNEFNRHFQTYKRKNHLPEDMQLIMDAEPQALGIHRLFITITTNEEELNQYEHHAQSFSTLFKKCIASIGFKVIKNCDEEKNDSYKKNWINIIINFLAIGAIGILSIIFPPSLFLTIGLTSLSFLTTAFTGRNYLINFFKHRHGQNMFDMNTTVTLGWFLSFIHTLYHVITMPLVCDFSMIFMCFIMPVTLFTLINGMDEIKRQVLNQSKKMHLKGLNMLFPQMANEYECYQCSSLEQELFSQSKEDLSAIFQRKEKILTNKLIKEQKSLLKEGMLVKVNCGECFPVDCKLIYGHTLVDSSLLTGEPKQSKRFLDFIPAGAINLSEPVIVYATQNPYQSTVNQMLFRANRAQQPITAKPNHVFTYVYSSLILIGLITAICAPLALGILTFSLSLQNITGILFVICPCTIALAHELPNLISIYHRSTKGIMIRDKNLCSRFNELDTIVFDKTGTLTTGNSQVDSSIGISSSLWEKVYLLEKHYGCQHPLAKAITHHYATRTKYRSIIQSIDKVSPDPSSRGLSAHVQGKQIHVGNSLYLAESGIKLPKIDTLKTEQGLTAVYVAEDKIYKGVIYIKHEIRADVLATLDRLKKKGKQIIMLTGDSPSAAIGFNQQNGVFFAPKDIYASQSPQDKENFLSDLMSNKGINPHNVWFVGDGLNDASCAKIVTEKGGVSCAITSEDKASFFTDISLNGSLNYLFEHNKLNQFLKKNKLQNQGLLIYGTLAFIAFIVSFSIAGIAVSPIIPLIIMTSTTLMVLFNSYRMQLTIDSALDKNTSWFKQFLASDLSIGLLVMASLQFMCGLLISTMVKGGLSLLVITFTAGAAPAISSLCLLTAVSLSVLFIVLASTSFLFDKHLDRRQKDSLDLYKHSSLSLKNSFVQGKNIVGPLSIVHEKTRRNESLLLEQKWTPSMRPRSLTI
ncbi:HAD-IC family P-type ATPase [Legionella sp.]|uniref:HAD-IC family P-type ATPase n=1 Tax=Legionella sp. TaxID=459 RepID=UPI003CA473F6